MTISSIGPGGDSGEYQAMADINVTPMVDVMLVLLIIFMVAAPLMMVGVPVELPKTAAAKMSQPKKPVIVTVNREGRLFIAEQEVEPSAFAGRLAELRASNPDAIVYVRGDRGIPYGRVMEVMGRVGQAGFSRISLISEALPGERK
jgi:biopolymer transport protein TolR